MNYLRREIRTRRILVKPSFQDFDRINVLHVTYEQFTRALTKLGLSLPDICFKILARKYMDKNNTREINYERFLRDTDYEHLLNQHRNRTGPNCDNWEANPLFNKDGTGANLGTQVNSQMGVDPNARQNDAKLNGTEPIYAPYGTMEMVAGLKGQGELNLKGGNKGGSGPGAGVNLGETDQKNFNDENAVRFGIASQRDFRPAGLECAETRNRNNPINFTALGNSQLRTAKDIGTLEERIKAYVVMYKIRIDQFFIDFDKLRKGSVSQAQFRRVLKLSGIDIEDYQFNLLVEKYQLDNGQNMDWFSFCRNIDVVFTTRGIEKNPEFEVPQIVSDTTIPARRYYLKMNEQDREKLFYILKLIRHEIETRRILFKPHFQDFDVVKNGFVTRSQFLRVLSQFDIYPQDEYLDVILRCYTDNSNLNEVNYYEFCKDVDGQDETTQTINNIHASRFKVIQPKVEMPRYIYKDSDEDITQVLARLQKKIKEERIRVSEFLRDFDRLRSGHITNAQFRIGLNMAKLPLSNSDFVTITEYFSVPEKPGFMRWLDFCDAVDQVFNVKALEMNPERQPVISNVPNRTLRESMGPFDQELAKKLIERFKFFTLATRLYVKQFFQDWDRLGRNKVTPKQFRQVLATVKFNMTDPEFRAITNYYLSQDGYMNYVDFIRDTTPDSMATPQGTSTLTKSGMNALGQGFESEVINGTQNAPIRSIQQPSAQGPATTQPPLVQEPAHPQPLPLGYTLPHYSYMPDLDVDPMKILERIKRDVRISRTRLREYMQDFDGLRKGTMTINKFFGSLDKLKLQITPREAEALTRIYQDLTDPDKIEYVRFVNDVDLVFTTPGLEKNPLYRVNPYKIPTFLDPKDRLNQSEMQRLHEIFLEIGNYVRVNRILIKPFFKDKDKAHSGKIGFSRFRAIMDTCNVPITDEAYHLLSKRYFWTYLDLPTRTWSLTTWNSTRA